ncbi:hypothetical protein [Proteus terrae]|uniref:hypothetical protein n=1 Tax=Proteus terrae TaxID=1574161 RepID=UPI00298D0ABB|nr:hypothetical protein [Proteus terrae]WPC97654.1 hypothetical protein R5P25_12365 [Proteus terrae]
MNKMYHFTRVDNLPSIQKEGIRLGKNLLGGPLVVSMTTNPCSKGLGLQTGLILEEDKDFDFVAAAQSYPTLVSKLADGRRIVRCVDQTEVRLEITIPRAKNNKVLTYGQLFNRDAKQLYATVSKMPYSKISDKVKKLLWAIPIHSADYPFGTKHYLEERINREVQELVDGIRDHRASEWRFATIPISPSYITRIEYRQDDGSYA